MRFVTFSLMIGLVVASMHLYLYRRIVRRVIAEPRQRRMIAGFLVFVTVLVLLRHPIREIGPGVEHVYEVATYSWLALVLGLLVAGLVGELVSMVRWGARRLARMREGSAEGEGASEPVVDLGRRRFVADSVQLGVLAGGGATAAYGAFRAFAPPEVTETVVRLPRLPGALDGLTIVQLTDVHVGPFIDRRFLAQLVDMSNAVRPDLVAITGDLVDGDVATLGSDVATLAGLRSRYGTYFVTGNHEYYSGEQPWCRFLDKLGIEVLRNRRVSIGDRGASIDLVGVDDWSGGRRRGRNGYDLDAALVGRDPERAAVLLAHQPANFDAAAARGMGLQLSGHTHGGQLFPMTMLIGLAHQYTRGLYGAGDSHIYVSRGCGFWGPPARVGSPPEIATIRLTV